MNLKRTLATLAIAAGLGTTPIRGQEILHSPHQGSDFYQSTPRGYLALGNVALNSALAGVGALINKKPVLPALKNGALGGLMQYAAKDIAGRNLALSWPAKAINAVGTAITTNAARGKPSLSDIGMDIGPIYLRLTQESGRTTFRPYLLPDALLTTTIAIASGDHFELEKSLVAGTPIFRTSKPWFNAIGNGVTSVVRYDRGLQRSDWDRTTCRTHNGIENICRVYYDIGHENTFTKHENIHALQYASSRTFTALLGTQYDVLERTSNKTGLWLLNGAGTVMQWTPTLALPYKSRPWEIEAEGLATHRENIRVLETRKNPI